MADINEVLAGVPLPIDPLCRDDTEHDKDYYSIDHLHAYGAACARATLTRKSEDLIGLAHELWAMAQGGGPVEEAAEAMAQRMAAALGVSPSGPGSLSQAPTIPDAGEVLRQIVAIGELPTHPDRSVVQDGYHKLLEVLNMARDFYGLPLLELHER